MYVEVDMDNWNRRATYDFFKDYDDPFFNFTGRVDATALYRLCKENGLSFSLAALFYSQIAANEIREFRTRMVDGRLVEFDQIHATQTILNHDETFSFAYFEMMDDVFEFDRADKAAVEKYKALKSFDVESERADLIYYSVIPWVAFTSFKHASRFDRMQTIPRIVFGKLFDDTAHHKQLPLSVEANHMIMDGLHVGRFFNRFQGLINSV